MYILDRGLVAPRNLLNASGARENVGWNPKYTFEKTVQRLVRGEQWKSDLTATVGMKGYHAVSTGVYTKR